MAPGFRDAPLIVKVYFISCHVSLLFFILGFSTPYWIAADGMIPINLYDMSGDVRNVNLDRIGLWHACGDQLPQDLSCIEIPITHTPAWYGATRVFETFGLIAALLLSVGMVLWIFIDYFHEMARAQFILMVTTFVTAFFIILGVIIWGATVKHYLHWSYVFTCMSGVIYTIIGFILVCSMLAR